MGGIGISYGDSGYFRSLLLALCPRREKRDGFVALRHYEAGRSSLGTLNEVRDRVTAIKQLRGDEAEETLGKF
jgi:hypothetical protein